MKKTIALVTFLSSCSLQAGTEGVASVQNPWFFSIGTGYAWSKNTGVSNPDPNFWDFSAQGYDAKVGNRGFYSFAVGKQVHQYIDISLSYINPENFNYVKYQTGSSNTPGFTGANRVRYFTLDNRSLLVNAFVRPIQEYLIASVGIKPFVGAGIGYASNKVYDFYTVAQVTVGNTSVGSITAIGLNESRRNAIAWQGSAGLSFNPNVSHVSVDVGYRYYDGGKFTGPGSTFSQTSGNLAGPSWTGRLKTNQIYVDFRYTV